MNIEENIALMKDDLFEKEDVQLVRDSTVIWILSVSKRASSDENYELNETLVSQQRRRSIRTSKNFKGFIIYLVIVVKKPTH